MIEYILIFFGVLELSGEIKSKSINGKFYKELKNDYSNFQYDIER